jgi:predicted nucleotidyltransferase
MLEKLGQELDARGVTGEIVLVGGAVMLLIVGSREATRDVDAYFVANASSIRDAAAAVGEREGLPPDWINDAAKGFFYTEPPTTLWMEYPGLRVYAANADYVLAMKALAGRPEDLADMKALAKHINVTRADDVLAVVQRYVPERFLTTRTQLLIEDLFSEG